MPYPQTHPDRLAVIAALHGLPAAPPESCRVLQARVTEGLDAALATMRDAALLCA